MVHLAQTCTKIYNYWTVICIISKFEFQFKFEADHSVNIK